MMYSFTERTVPNELQVVAVSVVQLGNCYVSGEVDQTTQT